MIKICYYGYEKVRNKNYLAKLKMLKNIGDVLVNDLIFV